MEAEPDEELMAEMDAAAQRRYLESLEAPTYTELASGLNYLNEGEWTPSVAVFENFEEGIVARQGQTKVILSHNLNDPNGSVDLLASDGGRQRSSVWGIAYFDRLTGRSVMIAQRKEGRAVLVPPNQVVYLDAFEGDVIADLRYTYEVGFFEQDVVLRENPPAPEAYGLNPETTVLEVWTEFAESPVPEIEQRVLKEGDVETRDLYVQPDIVDERLDFGAGRMVQGKAFSLAGENEEGRREVPTAKRWVDLGEDGLFLIEAVEYSEVADDLGALPEAQVNVDREASEGRAEMMAAVQRGPLRRIASVEVPAWGEALTAVVEPSETLMASAADFTQRPGYVLDYITESGSDSNYTFKGGATYYIVAPYTLSGATTVEGGAVIKVNTTSDYISITGTMDFQTAPYRPAIITSKNDNTVGETISGSSGNPTKGEYSEALRLATTSALNIEHLRVRYADKAINVSANGGEIKIRHTQFFKCQYAYSNVSTRTAKLHNILAYDFVDLLSATYQTVELQHVTADLGSKIVSSSYNSVTADNCLFSNVTNTDNFSGTATVSNPGGTIYQTAGAGNFYLAPGSTYRNAGTASVNADLLSDLQFLTTYPPDVLDGTYSSDLELTPIVPRDNDGTPDLGYHYTAADYVLDDAIVGSSAELILSGGVSVLVTGNQGVDLRGVVTSRGTVTAMNRVTQVAAVQEQPQSGHEFVDTYNASGDVQMDFRFTEFNFGVGKTVDVVTSIPGKLASIYFRDCHFYSSGLSLFSEPNSYYPAEIELVNNLIVRGRISMGHTYYSLDTDMTVRLYNNLFLGGSLSLTYDEGEENPQWYVRDNYFDGASQSLSGDNTGNITRSHNAFTTGTTNSLGGSSNQTGFTSSYEPGPFGDYYIPIDTYLDYLQDAGSRSASAAGLFHYTQEVYGHKDTGTVDIGLHYVAVDEPSVSAAGLVTFDSGSLLSYGGQDAYPNDYTITDGGAQLYMEYNNWKAIQIGYQVTTNTVLAYWFKSDTNTAEVQGVGFDDDLGLTSTYAFQNYGTQTWAGIQDYNDYTNGEGWRRYVVPVGEEFTGWKNYIFFINDDDTSPSGKVYYRNVWLGEDPTGTGYFTSAVAYDSDGDGIPDYVEDADGDGTVDAGETDFTDMDTDDDGLSDFGELGKFGSDPTDDDSMSTGILDAQYFLAALGGSSDYLATLTISEPNPNPNDIFYITISDAPALCVYDLYFLDAIPSGGWKWRLVHPGIRANVDGDADVTLKGPEASMGYFVILVADDFDGDGLSDGYEAWFVHEDGMTVMDNPNTDNDSMDDGWEAQYGLDPTIHDDLSEDHDGDGTHTNTENYLYHQSPYPGTINSTYDPLDSNDRPILTIEGSDSDLEDVSFTIKRWTTDTSAALTVYYAVGGNLIYDTDYTLSPAPPDLVVSPPQDGYPRIFSVEIPASSSSVEVTVDPQVVLGQLCADTEGALTIVLVPYGVAVETQVPVEDADDWEYVIDWNYSRVTLFDDFYLDDMDGGPTAAQLAGYIADQIMADSGATITVSNPSFTGEDEQGGIFGNGFGTGLPINEGVILSTGNIADAAGPNDADEFGNVIYQDGTEYTANGYDDLEELVEDLETTDYAVLQFDISSNIAFNLSFKYVFASEEYHYYIGDFNDIMAIWIREENVALVGDPTPIDVISVNKIHDGRLSALGNNPWNLRDIYPENSNFFLDNEFPPRGSIFSTTV